MKIVKKIGFLILSGLISNGISAQEGGKTRSEEPKPSQEIIDAPTDQPLKKGIFKKQLPGVSEKTPTKTKMPVMDETVVTEPGSATEVIKNSNGELEMIRKDEGNQEKPKTEELINNTTGNSAIKTSSSAKEASPNIKNKKGKRKGAKAFHSKKGAKKKKFAKAKKAIKH